MNNVNATLQAYRATLDSDAEILVQMDEPGRACLDAVNTFMLDIYEDVLKDGNFSQAEYTLQVIAAALILATCVKTMEENLDLNEGDDAEEDRTHSHALTITVPAISLLRNLAAADNPISKLHAFVHIELLMSVIEAFEAGVAAEAIKSCMGILYLEKQLMASVRAVVRQIVSDAHITLQTPAHYAEILADAMSDGANEVANRWVMLDNQVHIDNNDDQMPPELEAEINGIDDDDMQIDEQESDERVVPQRPRRGF